MIVVTSVLVAAAFVIGFIVGAIAMAAKYRLAEAHTRSGTPVPARGFEASTPSAMMPIPNPPNQTSAPVGAIQRMDGTPLQTRKAWGEIPYNELGPMFLDQFLLRYFAELMEKADTNGVQFEPSPWDAFAGYNSWAKEMPLLFEQLTSYKLNDLQLNNAIAEYARRLQTSARKLVHGEFVIGDPPDFDADSAATPGPRKTETTR